LVYKPGEDAKAVDYYLKLGNSLKKTNMVRAIYSFQQAFKIKKESVAALKNRENIESYPHLWSGNPVYMTVFLFFNEIDILKIRIEELKNVVDKFIWLSLQKLIVDNQSLYTIKSLSMSLLNIKIKLSTTLWMICQKSKTMIDGLLKIIRGTALAWL
jgi:hypothetical protein